MRGAPAKEAGGAGGSKADDPISIAALAERIERAIGQSFPGRVTVRGEVSGARHRTHFYFNLKDEQAVISAVLFASAAKRSGVQPRDGRVVIASGRLEYYKPQGRLSLIVDRLAEEGAGSLDAQFRALCEELRGLGWFDAEAKRPLPVFPRRIAVLTSASSAALQDVLDTTRRRCCAVDLVLVDVPVQGERAAGHLAAAVDAVSRAAAGRGIDAVLLTRGGGSVEDLWCFNDRGLAEAIRRCRVPVVAAIGHESDTTIAELVADRRAATPTQAAMLLTPDRDALEQQVAAAERRTRQIVRARLEAERRHLGTLARRPVLADPRQILGIQRDRLAGVAHRVRTAQRERLAALHRTLGRLEIAVERRRPASEHARRAARLEAASDRLHAAMRHALSRRRDRVDRLAAVTEAIGPAGVLRRGFSITTTPEGTLLRSALDARPGDRLVTRFRDGAVESTVDDPAGAPPAHRLNPRKATRSERTPAADAGRVADAPPDAPQMDLFGGGG